jgi:hypothetical protein
MNDKIYLHEIIDIVGHGRASYFAQVAARSKVHAKSRFGIKGFGCWGTVGSTGRWPEVINIWEYDGWEALAGKLAFETGNKEMQDPELKEWWAEAVRYRSGGFDRLLIPADYSPTREAYFASGVIGAPVFYHEIVKTPPGEAFRYLDSLERDWLPVARDLGASLVGAYRTMMRNDAEALTIWAFPTWKDWVSFQSSYEKPGTLGDWLRSPGGVTVERTGQFLCSAPESALNTGKTD